jgi:hypothetical protein
MSYVFVSEELFYEAILQLSNGISTLRRHQYKLSDGSKKKNVTDLNI